MKNMIYFLTRTSIKEFSSCDNGIQYLMLMIMLTTGFILDTVFLPISLIISLLIKHDVDQKDGE